MNIPLAACLSFPVDIVILPCTYSHTSTASATAKGTTATTTSLTTCIVLKSSHGAIRRTPPRDGKYATFRCATNLRQLRHLNVTCRCCLCLLLHFQLYL